MINLNLQLRLKLSPIGIFLNYPQRNPTSKIKLKPFSTNKKLK